MRTVAALRKLLDLLHPDAKIVSMGPDCGGYNVEFGRLDVGVFDNGTVLLCHNVAEAYRSVMDNEDNQMELINAITQTQEPPVRVAQTPSAIPTPVKPDTSTVLVRDLKPRRRIREQREPQPPVHRREEHSGLRSRLHLRHQPPQQSHHALQEERAEAGQGPQALPGCHHRPGAQVTCYFCGCIATLRCTLMNQMAYFLVVLNPQGHHAICSKCHAEAQED